MLTTLKEELAAVEEAFISSISEGPEAVEAFYQSWNRLQTSLDTMLTQGPVDEEMSAQAHRVASTIEILASRFLELYETSDTVTAQLEGDLQSAFADLRIEELSPPVQTGMQFCLIVISLKLILVQILCPQTTPSTAKPYLPIFNPPTLGYWTISIIHTLLKRPKRC